MSAITLLIENPDWRAHRGLQARLKQVAEAARRAVKLKGGFSILLADDRTLRGLNRDFRGIDKATNVLSFPAAPAPAGHAGDIAIAYGVTKREAKAAGKSFADHALHLAVHGVLHLGGHDHIRPKDAKAMEALEVKILARFGIADPYAIMPQ
jgi:probable rRNA maturation factor